MQVFGRGVQLVSKGEAEPRDTKGKAAKSLKMVEAKHRISEAEVEQRGDSVETVHAKNGVFVLKRGNLRICRGHVVDGFQLARAR